MTKYRLVNDGTFWFLQYQKTNKFLWFFEYKTWEYIPLAGRFRMGFAWDVYVNSSESDVEEFPKRWPQIEPYLEHVQKLENEHIRKENEKYEERQRRSKIIKNLN